MTCILQHKTTQSDNLTCIDNGTFLTSDSFLTKVDKYAIPSVCLFGIIGNTLSGILFLRKPLRNTSCSWFLSARCFSDNGFLISLFTVWTSLVFRLDFSRKPGICQSLIFATFMFGCTSVWLVVFITAETYVRICKPYIALRICTTRNAKCMLLVLIVLVCCTLNFPLWTFGQECVPHSRFFNVIEAMIYVDCTVSLIVPTVIIFLLIVAITLKAISVWKKRHLRKLILGPNRCPLTQMIYMLIAVAVSFLVLNFPTQFIRFRLMVNTFVEEKRLAITPRNLNMQSVAKVLFYLSMALNIIIYYFMSTNFRRALNRLFLKQEKPVQRVLTNRSMNDSEQNRLILAERNPSEIIDTTLLSPHTLLLEDSANV